MMRTLLALLLAFILIVTNLQADAVNEERMKEKGNLISEAGLGRKANAGNAEARDLPYKNSSTKTSNKSDDGDDDDDGGDDDNDSYQNYGNNSGSSTGTHRIITDARRPPATKPPTKA